MTLRPAWYRRSLGALVVLVVVLTVPVALSSARSPTTVKVPAERDATCNTFNGKRSVVGSVRITRLKNGDIQFAVTDRGLPGSTVKIYPWYYDGSCNYFYDAPTFKLDSSGVGSTTFVTSDLVGRTNIGLELFNNTTGVYDVTPTVPI